MLIKFPHYANWIQSVLCFFNTNFNTWDSYYTADVGKWLQHLQCPWKWHASHFHPGGHDHSHQWIWIYSTDYTGIVWRGPVVLPSPLCLVFFNGLLPCSFLTTFFTWILFTSIYATWPPTPLFITITNMKWKWQIMNILDITYRSRHYPFTYTQSS